MSDIRENMAFSLRCNKCGSYEFTIPDEATHDSLVTCSDCWTELAKWSDVQAAIRSGRYKEIHRNFHERSHP